MSLPQQALKNVVVAPPPPMAAGRSIPTVELSEEKPHQHVSLPTRPVDHDATTALVRGRISLCRNRLCVCVFLRNFADRSS